jgi:hypothetical protein
VAHEKAKTLRKFFGSALPALDMEGISYDNKLAPQGPITEEAGFIVDVPAVRHPAPADISAFTEMVTHKKQTMIHFF